MWHGIVTSLRAALDTTTGTLTGATSRMIEFFLLWQYGHQAEGQRRKRPHLRRQQQQGEQLVQQHASQGTTTTSSSHVSYSDDAEMCHRQAVAGLTLLGQRLPNLMGGYYRQTLQSFYGNPFTTLSDSKKRREQIREDVWLYPLNVRRTTVSSLFASTSAAHATVEARSHLSAAHHEKRSVVDDDIPLLVWLVMPWETGNSSVLCFVLRLASSLGCDALFVTVPMGNSGGPAETVRALADMIEAGKGRTRARRVLIGGSDLAAMFVLLLLESRCPLLHVGTYAAADPGIARRAFCQGVILVDPFVGWETPAAMRRFTAYSSSSSFPYSARETSGSFNSSTVSQPQASAPLSAKDRFKQVVINSSGGCIQQWFPSYITYEAPPMVVLVDENGFWLQEQCEFNARVDRFEVEENEERVHFLPYTIETAAAGTMVSSGCRTELERLWRLVERFLSDLLTREEPSQSSTPIADGHTFCREDGGGGMSRLCEGEATFRAAFAP